MNLFWREIRSTRKSLILWLVGIVAMVAGGMGKYAGLTGSGDAVNELMDSMPSGVKAVMGIGELDISTAIGYYGLLFLYLIVMAAIHASMLGANMVSKEERDKTAEFLGVKPISRSQILTSKLLAAVVNIVVFNMVMLITSISVVTSYAEGESVSGDISLLMLGLLLVQLLFLSIGMMIAAVSSQPKRAVALSAGVMLLSFLLSMVIDVSGRIDFLQYATPFEYFDAARVLREGIDWVFVILTLVLILISLSMAYIRYNRRDLRL